jgi:hypothetical protein
MRLAFGTTCAAIVLAMTAACGDSSPTTPGEGEADASTDAPGGDGSTDAGLDGATGADAPADGGGGGDSGTTIGDLEVEIGVDALAQNCMPIVAPDPATVQGTLTIKNNGKSPVGPLVFTQATVYPAAGGQPVATFEVDTTTQEIAVNGTGTSVFEKQKGTLAPMNGCATLACDTLFVIELAFSGPGAPPGAKMRSKPKKMLCTQ